MRTASTIYERTLVFFVYNDTFWKKVRLVPQLHMNFPIFEIFTIFQQIVRTPENAQIIIKSSQDSSSAVDPKWVLGKSRQFSFLDIVYQFFLFYCRLCYGQWSFAFEELSQSRIKQTKCVPSTTVLFILSLFYWTIFCFYNGYSTFGHHIT